MLRIEQLQASDEALLCLDSTTRRRLARVLADWLSLYAGMKSTVIERDSFDLVVEARRLLLSPDEGAD
jgi:hypothetical protein